MARQDFNAVYMVEEDGELDLEYEAGDDDVERIQLAERGDGRDGTMEVGERLNLRIFEDDDGNRPSEVYRVEYLGIGEDGPLFEVLRAVQGDEFDRGDQVFLSDNVELGGSDIADQNVEAEPAPICFAAGTMIATPNGETAVEELQAGDLIVTADGRHVAVKWLGRQTVSKLFTSQVAYCPVRIRAGALGTNTPSRDLLVTGDHGILVAGVMVNAAALVNGTTIVRVNRSELPDEITYYHVETEDHAVIRASGADAETYVDATKRRSFDNYGEYVARFGEPGDQMEILPYPRAFGHRQVPQRVRMLIEARAAQCADSAGTSGAQSEAALTAA